MKKSLFCKMISINLVSILFFSQVYNRVYATELPTTDNETEIQSDILNENIYELTDNEDVCDEDISKVTESDIDNEHEEQIINSVSISDLEEGENIDNSLNNIFGLCGDSAEWTYDSGVLTIWGTGSMYSYNVEDIKPWDEYSDDIFNIVISDGITEIGDYSFAELSNAINISLPASIINIGSNIIDGDALIESIIIQENLVNINDDALTGASGLNKVVNYSSVSVKLPTPYTGHWIDLSSEYRVKSDISQITQSTAELVNEYEITYVGNECDDENTYTNEYYVIGKEYFFPSCIFTKSGCEFEGWNTQSDGNGISYDEGEKFIDLTEDKGHIYLYAKWNEKKSVTIVNDSDEKVKPVISITSDNNILNQTYNGDCIDVSRLFVVEGDCGSETYTLGIGGTGIGILSLDGVLSNITKGGTFVIELNISSNSSYLESYQKAILNVTIGTSYVESEDSTDDTSSDYDVMSQDEMIIESQILDNNMDTREYSYQKNDIETGVEQNYTNETSEWGEITEKDKEEQNISSLSDVPDDLWVTGISDQDYNGSAITFSDLHVYWYNKMLVLGADYTVKYANNVNSGTATVTIIGCGNYSGTITRSFIINKLSLGDGQINNTNLTALDIVLAYNNRVQKGTTNVTYRINGIDVTLKSGTDFKYVYDTDSNYRDIGVYYVSLVGKGNYTGTAKICEQIVSNQLLINKLKFINIIDQSATGNEVKPGVTIKDNSYTLVEGIDYNVTYQNNISPGVANAIVIGKGNYLGTKVVTFKIKGISISKASVTGITEKEYTGFPTYQSNYELTYMANKGEQSEILQEGVDYLVSYSNEIVVGKNKASIIFTGINRFEGTLKKNYSINKYTLNEENVDIDVVDAVPYQKGGTKLAVVVRYGETILKEGTDYTVKYTNNTMVNDGINPKKLPTVFVVGKGNFSGTVSKTFTIAISSLDNVTMKVSDISYINKAGICKPTITLVDSNGNNLVVGTDYDKDSITYSYAHDVEVINNVNNKQVCVNKSAGTLVDLKNDIIPVGTEIIVSVEGINNYAGSTKSALFRYVMADISKSSVKISAQYYTGQAIELNKNDISVVINKSTLNEEDYEIVGYTNNIDKGSATVILRGIGNYGGSKTATFKITTKSMLYTIKYNSNYSYINSTKPYVKSPSGTMKNSDIALGKMISSNSFKLNGYTFAGWNTKADGTGESYSDKEKFAIKDSTYLIECYGSNLTLYAQWIPLAYKITYNFLSGGNILNNGNPSVYTIEDEIEFQSPERSGYVFGGWYKDSKFKTAVANISKGNIGNITLYAKWVPYTYTIKFDGNDASSGYMSSINAEIGKKVVLSANKFKKNNLIFVGWNTKKDGTGISYGDKATVYNLCKENGETVTLYAKWMLEGCDNLEYSDTTDMINSNGNYTVKKSDKWLLSAIVYDSLGNIVDSKSNKTNEKSYVPSTIDVSVSKKGEYYIKYTYCDYVKKSYKSPVYIDGQMVYRLYTKSGDTITEFMKLTVMEYPVKMTLSNGMDNNKTLKANTDTDITLTSSYWIYSCLITEGDIEYSNNTWSENGKPHYKYNIGKLPKGTYEVAVVEYPATEVGEMVYVNGKLTYTGTGVYYPDVQAKSSKKTWNCIISVE